MFIANDGSLSQEQHKKANKLPVTWAKVSQLAVT